MDLSRRQIDRMQLETAVDHSGVLLPSLKRKCDELGLKQDGSSVVLRQRLRRFKRDSEALEALQCPVCHCPPPQDELMVVCSHGHHLCFACLLQVVGRPQACCPLCRNTLELQQRGYLLQQLIPPALQDVVRSAPFRLYERLQHCSYFRAQVSLEQCRRMALLWKTPSLRASAENLATRWDAYLVALQQLHTQLEIGEYCVDSSDLSEDDSD